MTTVLIIIAAAGAFLALAFGIVKLAYRAGRTQGSTSATSDNVEEELRAHKAADEVLSRDVSSDDVTDSLRRGDF
jgi:cell division protein FtsL